MSVASWLPLISDSSMYIPSNDFAYMISKEMFDEFFLDGLIMECEHYKKSIYHLDGPGNLRHLDSLLKISALNAVQWVPGAGNEQVLPWMDVFKKVIKGGKSITAVPSTKEELQFLMDNLPAQGLCLQMWAKDESEAEDILRKVEKWPFKSAKQI